MLTRPAAQHFRLSFIQTAVCRCIGRMLNSGRSAWSFVDTEGSRRCETFKILAPEIFSSFVILPGQPTHKIPKGTALWKSGHETFSQSVVKRKEVAEEDGSTPAIE